MTGMGLKWKLEQKKVNPGIESHFKVGLFVADHHHPVIFTAGISNRPECLLQIGAGGRPLGSHVSGCKRNQENHGGVVMHTEVPLHGLNIFRSLWVNFLGMASTSKRSTESIASDER